VVSKSLLEGSSKLFPQIGPRELQSPNHRLRAAWTSTPRSTNTPSKQENKNVHPQSCPANELNYQICTKLAGFDFQPRLSLATWLLWRARALTGHRTLQCVSSDGGHIWFGLYKAIPGHWLAFSQTITFRHVRSKSDRASFSDPTIDSGRLGPARPGPPTPPASRRAKTFTPKAIQPMNSTVKSAENWPGSIFS